MILADRNSLPKSAAAGPETWSEAFGKVVDSTDLTMQAVENVTATQDNYRSAYQSYIDDVEKATGQKLQNPMDVDMSTGSYQEKVNPTYGFGSGNEWRDERARVAMDQFEAQRAALADQYPAQARLITLDVDGRVKARMQGAEKQVTDALASPELGMAGRLSAQLLGGLKGSARDPYQWAMNAVGAGAGVGATVATRIGRAIFTEALLNGGQEAILQAASQERKKSAGLEHGMGDALKNVGIAATFGALFGGTIQGAGELARAFKLGEGGAERAARVLDGNPEAGDVEALAKAMGVELGPEKIDLLDRSFENKVLDDVMVPADAPPERIRVLDAAMRHAEDPQSFPPPELVERMIADEGSGPTRALSTADSEQIYGGDIEMIDRANELFTAGELPPIAPPERLDAIANSAVPVGRQPPAPQSLMDFLASEGGIKDDLGELKSIGWRRKFVPGRGTLVRASGKSLDYAREAAAQAGYFDHIYGSADEASARSTVADLLDLLDAENRGNKAFTPADSNRVLALQDYQSQVQARADYREMLGRLETAMRELAPERGIDDTVLARATNLMIEENLSPLAAFDRAVLEDEARFADYLEANGEGYRNDPDYAEIPFFADEGTTAAAKGGSAGAPQRNSNAAGRQGNAADSSQSARNGDAPPATVISDPIDGQVIAPAKAAEPLDDGAMRIAEEQAGEIVEPARDANGNPENLLDFIGTEDGDGNIKIVSAAEALANADEGNLLADIMEACKL